MTTQWKSACRVLARRPAFAIATILILALGMGAATTLFSLVNTVLWKPLPYPNPDRLVTVYEANPAKNQNTSLLAPVRIEDWNRLNQTFVAISGTYNENVTDTSGSQPERLAGYRVAPRFFAVYGTPPRIGRTFTPDEERFGGPAAAVISYGLWRRRYQADPHALGRRLILGGRGYTIIGVMPDAFAPPSTDLWMPAQLSPSLQSFREARFYGGVGRMREGVAPSQAQADLSRVQAALGRQFPKTDAGWSAQVRDLKDARVGAQRASLTLLFAAVVLLLLIACANAGGMVLGQLHRREREMAIRGSLGAGRIQLLAVILREVAVLVACAAALGFFLAYWSVKGMGALLPNVPRIDELRLDWRALLFTIAAGLLAAAIAGVIPALQTLRSDIAGGLYQATRAHRGGRRLLQRGLVAAQFAVTLVLLLATGLLARSYSKLSRVDLGFDPTHVTVFHVGAEWGEDRQALGAMQKRLLAGFAGLPGVQAAGMTNFLPASGATLRYEVALQGSNVDADSGKFPVGERTVGADYFQALRIPVLGGETCSEPNADPKAPVKVVVNQSFVDKFANGGLVVGRRIRFGDAAWSTAPQIAGVVANVKEDGANAPSYPYVYMCLPAGTWPDPEYAVRTAGDLRQVLAAVNSVVHNVAPHRAVFGVTTLEKLMAESLETPRLGAQLFAAFGLTALLLAAVGLYSLVALAVTTQTKEIGLRVALGARPGRIVAGVIAEAATPVLVGLLFGAVLATMALRASMLKSLLFGVGVADCITMTSAVATLGVVSILAALLPARRAASIDPIRALREE